VALGEKRRRYVFAFENGVLLLRMFLLLFHFKCSLLELIWCKVLVTVTSENWKH